MTPSADAVRTLLDRVATRMRWSRARDVAGKVSLAVLSVVIVEGLVARVVPLPGWQPLLVALAVVPIVAGVGSLLRPPAERAIRRTAGDWIDTPSLFLSSSGARETRTIRSPSTSTNTSGIAGAPVPSITVTCSTRRRDWA